MMNRLFILLLVCLYSRGEEDTLQLVQDEEFSKLIRDEPIVVALFCTSSIVESCEEYEAELASVREDFIDMMQGDAWLVKLTNSNLVNRYSPSVDKPVIVMFRQGLPVLYDGPANGELMLDTFVAYKEPGVKELTDTTFEHLTQASSGATTGDWLVLFYTDECEKCFKMVAVMETVACKHRGRINVARVNKQTHGEKTGRRFQLGIDNNPQIVFFRSHKLYKYDVEKYDVGSLTSFITGFYKNYPAEAVPLPKSPFDDLVQLCVDYMKEYPVLVGCGVAVPILLLLAFLYLISSDEEKIKKKKKKKSKDK